MKITIVATMTCITLNYVIYTGMIYMYNEHLQKLYTEAYSIRVIRPYRVHM